MPENPEPFGMVGSSTEPCRIWLKKQNDTIIPMKQKFWDRKLDQTNSRISNYKLVSLSLMQYNPMVAIPMADQRKGNRIEVI